jgi:prephenate dehydratase
MSSKDHKNPDELVAFQGAPGAHGDMACRHVFPYMETLPCASFDEVFHAVEQGRAKYGMIPIENSQAGRVAEIHNILPQSKLHFIGEHFHKVEHHLMAPKGATLESLKEVHSHPQAILQCRNTLNDLGLTDRRSHSDTAGAARDIAEWNDKDKAALASRLAAELYGLEILKEHAQDDDENTTVFVTLSREPIDPDPQDGTVLTTLLFTVRNIPSALYKAMGGFATNGVNMIKLESYLTGNHLDTAQFFATFEGYPNDRSVQLALEELGFYCKNVQVLGVYHADEARYV